MKDRAQYVLIMIGGLFAGGILSHLLGLAVEGGNLSTLEATFVFVLSVLAIAVVLAAEHFESN